MLGTTVSLVKESAAVWAGLKCFDAVFAPALTELTALSGAAGLPKHLKV